MSIFKRIGGALALLFGTAAAATARPPVAADGSEGLLGAELAIVEKQSGFFGWFHLEPYGPATADGTDSIQAYKPSGDAFRSFVTLNIRTNADGRIVAFDLLISHDFIESPRNGVFAADLAKSFLRDAVGSGDKDLIEPLAAEIEARAHSGGTTIIMSGDPPAPPSGPPSRTYQVYRGQADSFQHTQGGVYLALQNETASGEKVLRIAIRSG